MMRNGVQASALGLRCFPKAAPFRSDVREQTVEIPGLDGVLYLGDTQAPRSFPLHLRVNAASASALRDRLDAITTWLNNPAPTVFDEMPGRYWITRLAGELAWESTGASRSVQADINLVADDPHAYALIDDTATRSTPGTFTRAQGNAASWPTVTIAATLSAAQTVTLNLWGRTVTVSGPLAASERAVLDYQAYTFTVTNASGTPLRNLAPKLSNLARVSCPVGGGAVSWTTTGSVASVAVACNSRWI